MGNCKHPKERHMAAEDKDLNRDPITGEAGSHPIGTGVGAVGGAVAGAASGAAGGAAGMVVGGVVGAIVGGGAGHAAAEAIDPKAEEKHWRETYQREPYYEKGRSFDDYSPAYRLGVTGRTRYETWDTAEPQLRSEWQRERGTSGLEWDQAQPASRAAWERVDVSMRGAAIGDMNETTSMGHPNDTGLQTEGAAAGDTEDVIDVLQDLAECSLDGEYGFKACADQASSAELKSIF